MPIAKSLIAAVALVAAGTAATASEYRTFKHEGVTYTYKVINRGEKQVIVGKSELLGQTRTFTLTVKGDTVRGNVDGRKLAFLVNEARAQNVMLASD